MSSRAAGSVLLRHLGPRVFGPVSSPAAAAPRPLAGGGERGAAAVWMRLLSTSAAEAKEEAAASKGNAGSTAAAKAEAAEAAKEGEGKKSPVVSSYWGIEPSKLVSKEGVEWRWSCFRVSDSSQIPAQRPHLLLIGVSISVSPVC